MEDDSILSILIMVVLLILSAYFSATETAFSSINRIRLKSMADSGDKRAKAVYDLSESFDKLLSTVLIGNNIVNIALASLGTVLFVKSFGNIGATISSVVVTVVVLIFGEITPKSLAKENPESFALFSAPLIRFLMFVLTPLSFLFSKWKQLISKLFKVKRDNSVTEDELLTIVDEAQHHGGIDEQESELIRSAIEFTDLTADDILTPRVDVTAISITDKNSEIARLYSDSGYSRLPVYDGSIDNIIGVLLQKDFYGSVYHHDKTVTQVMSEPIFITGSMPIVDLLKKLQTEKTHMAVIVDEYGGTEGIVTMEDILEELVGEIWDEHDRVIPNIIKSGNNCFKVKGTVDFAEFAEYFGIDEQTDSSTVGGWVMEKLGRIADVGDMFKIDGMTVLVSNESDRRVNEIIVKIQPNDENNNADD